MSDYDAIRARPTSDEIYCVTANQKYLIVGRESGTLHRYTLPHISLESQYMVRCVPHMVGINCDSTRLSIIDMTGILTFFDCEAINSREANEPNGGGMSSPGDHGHVQERPLILRGKILGIWFGQKIIQNYLQ